MDKEGNVILQPHRPTWIVTDADLEQVAAWVVARGTDKDVDWDAVPAEAPVVVRVAMLNDKK